MKKRRTNAADDTALGYDEGLVAIRLERIRAGRFLPRAGHPDEIKASPHVRDVHQECPLYPQ